MTSATLEAEPMNAFKTDNDRWQAVTYRDRSADGQFYYSVKTTGVFCRPSCAARLARRENVEFHKTCGDAERAGYRACKRCKPRQPSADAGHAAAIAKACTLIVESDDAPDLESLAAAVGLSASHFHRVFKALTGLTPKGYASAHRAHRVREALSRRSSIKSKKSITSAIYNAGFNSNGRFYATSSKTLGMTPATFRAGGAGTTIRFAVGECALGSILVAATDLGICTISLGDDPKALVRSLKDRFPNADLVDGDKAFEATVRQVISFVERPTAGLSLPLHVQGTAFQQRVWQKLCDIPCGTTRTYAAIAQDLGRPTATRAVAQACKFNPVAVAIPCHRVVRSDGSLSGYRWGVERKAKLLAAERAKRSR